MKFKIRNDYWKNHIRDETQLVSDIAETNAYGTRGELEDLRDRVQTLTEVIDYIVSIMPPDQVRQIANHFGYEEVK